MILEEGVSRYLNAIEGALLTSRILCNGKYDSVVTTSVLFFPILPGTSNVSEYITYARHSCNASYYGVL